MSNGDTDNQLGQGRRSRWVDNHCHLGLKRGPDDVVDDVAEVLTSAAAAGVAAMVCVGTDVESSRDYLRLTRDHDALWAAAGVHPHESSGGIDGLRDLLVEGIESSDRLVAVGECGLDYHYDHSPHSDQRREFAAQIALANEFDLPLVIHTRSAWDETFEILDAETTPKRTVFHCFTGGAREAEKCLERGALLSISGIVTFPSADDVREAVETTPIDRLMVETDSPFLAPVPYRGRANTPSLVAVVGEKVAEVKGLEVAEVAARTTSNAVGFYGLNLP